MAGKTYRIVQIVISLFSLILLFSSTAYPKIIYVDDDGPVDFNNIQAAIDDSNDGDIIIVKQGIYTSSGNHDIDFLGKSITVRSMDPNDPYIVKNTIIDCQAYISRRRGFYFHSGEDTNSILDGLTIIKGLHYRGGGICCDASSPTIRNCTISECKARDEVGGIIQTSYGGGLYCTNSNPVVINCTFTQNSAYAYGWSYGGAIHCSNSNLTIDNCTIKGNSTGQGMYSYGGGIHCLDSTLIITNCNVYDNTAWGGGGLSCSLSSVTLSNCRINGNRAFEYGGGILGGSSINITNTVISGNIAKRIGHDGYGGGIRYSGTDLTVTNCIIWDNEAWYGPGVSLHEGSSTSITYSNIQEIWEGNGNICTDPCYAENGYRDIHDEWVEGDYHLKSRVGRWNPSSQCWVWDDVTSPCIDAGDPNFLLGNEPIPNGNRINMGAYGGTAEASRNFEARAILADLNNNGIVNFYDFASQAKDWQKAAGPHLGDLNLDNEVDGSDLALFAEGWLVYSSLLIAQNPRPDNSANNVSIDTDLCWTPGEDTVTHKVYFGTDPCTMTLVATQPVGLDCYNPGDPNLTASTTYYWQVFEIDPNMLILPSPMWSFTTIPGEAHTPNPADHAVIPGNEIEYPPGSGNWYISTKLIFGEGPTTVKHTGYFSEDCNDVVNRVQDANLGPPPYGSISGFETTYYVGNPLVSPANDTLVRDTVYYWTVDGTDNKGNVFYGEIWEFTIQGYQAFAPNPPNEATFIPTNVLFSWREGLQVQVHDIYMGTSWEDVNNAEYDALNPPPEFLDTTSEPNFLVTDLTFNTKYFWRVDEIIDRMPFNGGTCYKGDIWCFTTVPLNVDVIKKNSFGATGPTVGRLRPINHTLAGRFVKSSLQGM